MRVRPRKNQDRRGKELGQGNSVVGCVEDSVEDNPENGQQENSGQVVSKDFLRRMRIQGRKHKGPADHHENAHTEARKAVQNVEKEKLFGIHGNIVPGRRDGMLKDHAKGGKDTKPLRVDFLGTNHLYNLKTPRQMPWSLFVGWCE